jgi:hypothetical protein
MKGGQSFKYIKTNNRTTSKNLDSIDKHGSSPNIVADGLFQVIGHSVVCLAKYALVYWTIIMARYLTSKHRQHGALLWTRLARRERWCRVQWQRTARWQANEWRAAC